MHINGANLHKTRQLSRQFRDPNTRIEMMQPWRTNMINWINFNLIFNFVTLVFSRAVS